MQGVGTGHESLPFIRLLSKLTASQRVLSWVERLPIPPCIWSWQCRWMATKFSSRLSASFHL